MRQVLLSLRVFSRFVHFTARNPSFQCGFEWCFIWLFDINRTNQNATDLRLWSAWRLSSTIPFRFAFSFFCFFFVYRRPMVLYNLQTQMSVHICMCLCLCDSVGLWLTKQQFFVLYLSVFSIQTTAFNCWNKNRYYSYFSSLFFVDFFLRSSFVVPRLVFSFWLSSRLIEEGTGGILAIVYYSQKMKTNKMFNCFKRPLKRVL